MPLVFRAVVRDGRLQMDEPSSLPEGSVVYLVISCGQSSLESDFHRCTLPVGHDGPHSHEDLEPDTLVGQEKPSQPPLSWEEVE